MRERDTLVVPKLDWLARFIPDARAKEKLHDNQPKLPDGRQRELCRMPATGEYSTSDLAELFPVSRPTAYRTLNGRIPLSVRSCPLPESTRPGPKGVSVLFQCPFLRGGGAAGDGLPAGAVRPGDLPRTESCATTLETWVSGQSYRTYCPQQTSEPSGRMPQLV